MFIFAWGAKLYYQMYTDPKDALEIFVTGKQWMWRAQHPDGQREINELHVPLGRRVKLTMTSEDVIHSYYIPAFRARPTWCRGDIRPPGSPRPRSALIISSAPSIVAPSIRE